MRNKNKINQEKESVKKVPKNLKSNTSKDLDQTGKGKKNIKEKHEQKEEMKVTKLNATKLKVKKRMMSIDKSVEKVTEELKDEVNIEELQQCVSTQNHNVMVDDILNQNNTRITNRSRGKGKSNSRAKKKAQNSETKNSNGSEVKSWEKDESKKKEEKNEVKIKKESKPLKEVKPKVKKVKEPKPKKDKPVKAKKIVKKIRPGRSKYQGKVVKKKFAPKKIGQSGIVPQMNNSEAFKVVSWIESDDEKEKSFVEESEIPETKEPIITAKKEPVVDIVEGPISEGSEEMDIDSERQPTYSLAKETIRLLVSNILNVDSNEKSSSSLQKEESKSDSMDQNYWIQNEVMEDIVMEGEDSEDSGNPFFIPNSQPEKD